MAFVRVTFSLPASLTIGRLSGSAGPDQFLPSVWFYVGALISWHLVKSRQQLVYPSAEHV